MPQQAWWKNTTIYQIYPRSFQDSNNDGIGDIPGIINRLDYLQNLGVETIWLSPFFASPQRDGGYDISGYREIAPEYGTLADAEQLIEEFHLRNMKVIFDLVLNHTSNQHPWFLESSSSKNNPKSDWYLWRDGRAPGKPPNNWKALPGGSGWHYHQGRDQWYYASFLPFQPDLNWHNPALKEEMFQIAKFWLDKGVDGFRLDIFHAIYKAAHFRDNPWHWSYLPKDEKYGFFTEWKYNVNQPETIQLAHELRQLLDEYQPERCLVGEIFGPDKLIKQYLGDGKSGMQMIFLWDFIDFSFQRDFIRNVLDHYENCYPPPYTPVLVLGNHDSQRWIDRVGGDIQKAKLVALLQLTGRGVPVIYYGEEIGLPEGNIPARQSLDPIGQRYAWAPNWLLKLLHLYINRDNCRTPMAWDSSIKRGFTNPTGDPWLPFSASSPEINVAAQKGDPDSLLSWYKQLLKLRKDTPALHNGSLRLFPCQQTNQTVLGFYRTTADCKLAVLLNMGLNPVHLDLKNSSLLLGTGEIIPSQSSLILGGLSGGIFQLSKSSQPDYG